MPDVRYYIFWDNSMQNRVRPGRREGGKLKRGWSPGDSLNLVRVLSVRVNYSQQCRNDINGRWEYSKSIMSLLRQNDVAPSFLRKDDVIITSCVCWAIAVCCRPILPILFRVTTLVSGQSVDRLALNTSETHYDVIKWKHFPRNWPFCAGN